LSCPEREQYIANANTLSGLENLLDEALEEIGRSLGNVAQVRGVQGELPLKRRVDKQILQTLPEDVRVWILDKKIWNQDFGPTRERGQYHPLGNKILLRSGNWCRKTVIHESLHSVSIFSHPSNWGLFEMTRLFAEGLTEFITGLSLFRMHRDCYDAWRVNRFPQWCSVSYPKETKIFLAFCGCANAQSLLDLYFGTQVRGFPVAWSSFVTAIRQDTGKPFKDVSQEAERIGFIMAFKNECEKQFGKKFRKIQKLLDYGRVFRSP